MTEDEAQSAMEEIVDGGDVVVDDATPDIDSLPEAEKVEAEEFAREFLTRVLRLRGVKIDREHFLRAELHKRGIGDVTISRAISENPAAAGIELRMLDRFAAEVVEFETRKSTAMSFAAGLPGGFAMLGTIPGDITQFYVHAFRIMQKVAYLYGWTSFLEDTDEIDDETLAKLAAFLGVMMGVGGASATLTTFAASVARPALQKQIAGVALTKTAWYTPMKQVLRVIGIKLTKDSFAKTVTKAVPVAGGVLSGGLTYATLRVQSGRLIRHLRELPPPHVDAEEYPRQVRVADDEAGGRAAASLRGRAASAVSSLREPRPHAHGDTESRTTARHATDAVKDAGAAAKDAASRVTGRIGGMVPRRGKKTSADDSDV